MKNYVQDGNTVTMIAAAAILSGAGQLTGALFGVALGDYASGAEGEFRVTGVVTLPKAGTGAITAYARVYWDATNKLATGTASGNTLIGVATVAVLAAATAVDVRLSGVPA